MRIAASVLLAGSAMLVQAQPAPVLAYEPQEAVLQNLQPSAQAVAAIKVGEAFVEGAGAEARAKVLKFSWRSDRLRVSYEKDLGAPTVVPYDAIPKAGAVREGGLFASGRWGVPLTPGWILWCEAPLPEHCAKALADVILYRKYRLERVREADRLFAEAVAKYKDPASRPPLPEEARKYRIQAEFALDRKNLGEAIELYTKGVVAARWWSDGYFNLALLLAEQKHFGEAIRIMKRFIALEAGSEQARRAVDMTYRWELELPADEREP